MKASAFGWVRRDVTILDVGCGFGEALGYHRARGCDAHGIEADRNILRVAQRHGLNVTAGLFEVDWDALQQFDIVTHDPVYENAAHRKDVLWGRSVVVSGVIGGRRCNKKKKNTKK